MQPLDFTDHNDIEMLIDAPMAYNRMITAIRGAKHNILLANFCMLPGIAFERFHKELLGKAERGVAVKILADAYGSAACRPDPIRALQLAGAEWVWFRPWESRRPWGYNQRLHKKLLIIDRRVGFTGGIGIADFWIEPHKEYPAAWRDTHFRVMGPAVAAMTDSFIQSWSQFSPLPLNFGQKPTADPKPAENTHPVHMAAVNSVPQRGLSPVSQHYIDMIASAHREIVITSAYFGPPKPMRQAMMEAARRGVSLKVLINGPFATHRIALEAGRGLYKPLLEAGVQIYEYQPTKIHSKLIVKDGQLTSLGSGNLNFRTAYHDEEFNLVVDDRRFSRLVIDEFNKDLLRSKEVTLRQWEDRAMTARLRQTGATLGRYFF